MENRMRWCTASSSVVKWRVCSKRASTSLTIAYVGILVVVVEFRLGSALAAHTLTLLGFGLDGVHDFHE